MSLQFVLANQLRVNPMSVNENRAPRVLRQLGIPFDTLFWKGFNRIFILPWDTGGESRTPMLLNLTNEPVQIVYSELIQYKNIPSD